MSSRLPLDSPARLGCLPAVGPGPGRAAPGAGHDLRGGLHLDGAEGLGRIQDRLGPTRVGGRFGWLQPPADGIKLLCKEDIIPAAADRLLFRLAPYMSFCAAFVPFLALPFARAGSCSHSTRPRSSSWPSAAWRFSA